MTRPEDSIDDEVRAWAAEVLQIPADAPRELVAATFLERVADEDCLLPIDFPVAFDVLLHGSPAEGEAGHVAHAGVAARLRAELARFGTAYFDLPPHERAATWESLRRRTTPYPALQRRVLRLESGLPLAGQLLLDLNDDSLLAKLAALVRECYVADPVEASRLRRAVHGDICHQRHEWVGAVWTLRESFPQFALLGADTLEWVLGVAQNFLDWNLQSEGRAASRGNVPTNSNPPQIWRRATQETDNSEEVDGTRSRKLVWILCAFFVLLKLLTYLDRTNERSGIIGSFPKVKVKDLQQGLELEERLKGNRARWSILPRDLERVPTEKESSLPADATRPANVEVDEESQFRRQILEMIRNMPRPPPPNAPRP